jgi:hypothetical protein
MRFDRNKYLPYCFVLTITLFHAGCTKDSPIPSNDNHQDVLIKYINIKYVSLLPSVLKESSGIVVSSSNRIWSHNDSGNSNQLFLTDSTGNLLRTLTISNAQNVDWEDVCADPQGRIYINDAGNNNNNRTNLCIYRISDPNDIEGNTVNADVINFTLEDQTEFPPPSTDRNYDIEAIAWKSDSIYMFTKDRSIPLTGFTKMYSIPATPGNHVAKLIDSYQIDGDVNESRVTAADINHLTGELVLLTRTRIISFKDYPNNLFFKGDIIDYKFTSAIGQAEAIGFIDYQNLFITEEGSGNTGGKLYRVNLSTSLY